jgi:hypothetical protein
MKSRLFSRAFLGFFLLMGVLATMTFYTSCKPEDVKNSVEVVESDANVARYVNMIKESQATGNSVFFQTEGDNWVENPTEQWLTEYVNKQYALAADRSSCDTYTLELQVLSGSFATYSIALGSNNWIWGGSGCFTGGNTYVSGATTHCVACPTIGGVFAGGPGCHTPGTTKVILHRITPNDCACFDYVKTVSTPHSAMKYGSYCCTVNYCW